MPRKSGLQIKRQIIRELKNNNLSIRKLETKLNTNNITIRKHLEELEFFNIVRFIKHKSNERNGRPFTTVELTDYGKTFAKNA